MLKRLLKNFAVIALVLTCGIISNDTRWMKDQGELTLAEKRARFDKFVTEHPYSNRDLKIDLKSIPKKDRPDLRQEQDYLAMLDPNTLTVPYERVVEAFDYTKKRFQMEGYSQPQMNQLQPGGSINFQDGNSNNPNGLRMDGNDLQVAISVGGNEPVWRERGPDNVGGRTRAIMWDPNDAMKQRVFAGGVAGGLWVNENILNPSSSWRVLDDFLANMAISDLTYDPTNTQVFYAGTGEGWFNGDAVRGLGVIKSEDGGQTWNFLASTDVDGFRYVQKIVVTSAGTVLAATRDATAGVDNGGIFRSTDGGANWTRVLEARGADIAIAANGDIYASRGIFSTASVSKSTDDGATWTDVTPPGGANPGRIELATAPTNANVIYAMAHNRSTNGVDYVQKSADAGASWTTLAIPTHNDQCASQATDFTRGQAWYDLILAVSPTDEDVVIAGGVDLARSDDGGTTWTQISEWANCSGIEDVHADHHQIVFRPGNPNEALFGTDGGIYYSPNAGLASSPNFTVRNKNYNVTQFYSVAADNVAGSGYFLAGAQDNGTQQFRDDLGVSTFEVVGGDGAFAHVDQMDRTYQIASTQNGGVRHSSDGGNSFQFVGSTGGENFINQTDLDYTAGILYSTAAADQIGRIQNTKSTNPGTPTAVSVNLGGRQTSAIRANTHTANRLFVGTEGGLVIRIDDANTTPIPTDITSNITTLGTVSSVDVGSTDDELIVTYSNFGVTSVWYSTDGGNNWINKDDTGQGLPDIPVRWALFNPENTAQVLLATELGVWSTNDITASNPDWAPTNEGLSNVRCDMLQYREADGLVAVATHARGVFTTDIFVTTGDATAPEVLSFTPADDEGDASPLSQNLEIEFSEPVVAATGNIVLRLSADGSEVETFDVTGGQISSTGTRVFIDPTADLMALTGYYVEVDAGAFEDRAGNAFAGISGSTTWNFTTFDGDQPPVVSIPIENQEVDENAADLVLDLSGVFNDPDNDNSAITFEVTGNTNTATVSTSIAGSDLTLSFVTDKIGLAQITVTATSNGKTVNDVFNVEVNPDADLLFDQSTPVSNSGRLIGAYIGTAVEAADDFVVPEGVDWSVNTVSTVAFSLGTAALNLQSVDVVIYDDNAGAPGAENSRQTVTVGNGQIIGGEIGNAGLTVRLNSAIDLSEGTYWLSVYPTFNVAVGTSGAGSLYAWRISGEAGNHYEGPGDGTLTSNVGSTLLFTISGSPSDFFPEVANPIDDILVNENPETNPIVVDLSNTFDDPDNDNSLISLSVTGNTNETLISTDITGTDLSLTVAADESGSADITVTATSNGLSVEETFNVTVNEVIPELYAQTGAVAGSSPSQIFPDFGNLPLESADNFIIADGESWEFRRVVVQGRGAAPANALIRIYENNGGLPGTVLFTSDVLPVETATTPDDTDFRLTIPEESAPVFGAGTYWITVQTVQAFSGGNQWFWEYTTPAVEGDYARQDPGQLLGGGFPPTWGVSGNNGALIFNIAGETLTAPNSPSDLAVSFDGTTSTITWTDNSDNETGFTIERRTVGGTFTTLGTTNADLTTFDDDGPFDSNQEYEYRVLANGAESNSGFSNFDSFLTLPGDISIETGTFTTGSFDLTITTNDAAMTFDVDVSTDGFTTFVTGYENLEVTSTSVTIDGLSSNVTYDVRARARNLTGTSEYATSTGTTLPDAVTVTSSNPTNSGFDLSFESPDGATDFTIDISTDDFATFVEGYENFAITGTSATISDLSSNTTYSIRARSENTSGSSANSDTIDQLTLPADASVASSNVTNDGFSLTFTPTDDASSFEVDISTDDFATFIEGYEGLVVEETSADVSGLSSNTSYSVRIRALNDEGTSGNSATITILTLPVAPGFSVTSSSTSSLGIGIASSDGSSTFLVDVSTDDFTSFVEGFEGAVVTESSTTISGLNSNTTYSIRVRARNSTGDSDNSSTVSGTTRPEQVTVAASEITTDAFLLSFTSPDGATEFVLDISTDEFQTFVEGYEGTVIEGTTTEVTGLNSNSTYNVRVSAKNASSQSEVSETINPLTLPIKPSFTFSDVTASGFNLTFESTDAAGTFQVDISADDFTTFVEGYEGLVVDATSLEVDDLSSNTSYSVRVRAQNDTGNSENSLTGDQLTLPASPQVSVANFTSSGFDVDFSSSDEASIFLLDISTDNFETFVEGYEALEVAANSTTVTGLSSNTAYSVRARAENDSGESDNSETADATTIAAAVTISASAISTESFTLTFTSPDGATRFAVDVSTDNFETFVDGLEGMEVSGNTQSINGLSSNTSYDVRAVALNDNGSSANSVAIQVLTLNLAPVATEASDISNSGFTANWTTPDNASTFQFDLSTDNFETFVEGFEGLELSTLSTDITSLDEGTYQYRVRATNGSGSSDNSNTITVTIEAPLNASLATIKELRAYPNPGPGLYQLDFDNQLTGEVKIQVFSIAGQIVHEVKYNSLSEGKLTIDLRDEQNGVYLMKISYGKNSSAIRLMKQ